jgi:hypothetical protein
VEQGREVVQRYISGHKGYAKPVTAPMVVIAEEKENLERKKPATYRVIENKKNRKAFIIPPFGKMRNKAPKMSRGSGIFHPQQSPIIQFYITSR